MLAPRLPASRVDTWRSSSMQRVADGGLPVRQQIEGTPFSAVRRRIDTGSFAQNAQRPCAFCAHGRAAQRSRVRENLVPYSSSQKGAASQQDPVLDI